MKRSLNLSLKKVLGTKIVLISGPRQTGKTTLSKSLSEHFEYLNYDITQDRKKILAESWDRSQSVLILDELHKAKKWKQWLKGQYDQRGKQSIVVTGSAKLDTFKKVGDSLAGRYFHFRLFPLDLKEICEMKELKKSTSETIDDLLRLSGFPEPYLSGKESYYRRWRQTHLDIILRQDVIEMESIKRIGDLEILLELLRDRVGSTFSYNSLREDLKTDDKTIKRWMTILENSYLLFKVTPYSNRLTQVIKKAPKFYFFDVPRVKDEGARFENLVALSLFKEVCFLNDTEGADLSLHFLRNAQGQEIDFVVCQERKPILMIEVKLSDSNPSNHFLTIGKLLGKVRKIQLVKNLDKRIDFPNGVTVFPAHQWLKTIELGHRRFD